MAFFDKFKKKKETQEDFEQTHPVEEALEEEKIEVEADCAEQDSAEKEKDFTAKPESESELVYIEKPPAGSESVGEKETSDEIKLPSPEKNKKGFLERFKVGLTRTRQNIGGKIDTLIKSTRKIDEDFFEELEDILIQADVGMNTSIELVDKIRTAVKKQKINDPAEVTDLIKEAIREILDTEEVPLNIADEKPTVILVVGVNGAGKTTSIAKLANRFKKQDKRVILAAGDTFRAAAIDQLQIWADRVGVELVKHQEGADPGAVVFDAISAAKARKADILIIDTAGRLQNKANLMKEISKVRKVIEKEIPAAPHEVLLVLDATTGQNAISQAKIFKEATGVSGIILTKLDGTAKGGIVIAVARELSIPVKMVGIGEGIEDLREFSPSVFAQAIFES
ncbi:Signal-recognition particle receptor FtsY [Syntrophomonas zehnderi OL-4]|uniref:Signal recognition particle receptor FtsY n=1 Tax=Syntrophomonas zehnderi OL-4 TaxID=690567 RepID=A0A0E4GC76_9FIRM|nr:signal recognition particle-docking protein FtsY [Syntrophomonas zehnderi]CFY05635.1 Signal-recognition particle receptor FtsY [Syntrophomonas zehnderi OL-4]